MYNLKMNTEVKDITIHMMILPWGRGFLGISRELGLVEEGMSVETVESALKNGIHATIETIFEQKLPLEENLKVRAPLKYQILYWFAPLMFYFKNKVNIISENLQIPNFHGATV